MSKLSVFIIVKNEEKNIDRCLRSVKWADEIVVVDSFSEDKTVEICRRYTDKIYKNKFIDYSRQKNFALSKTTGKWVLSLDADEEVTEALKDEIVRCISGLDESISGYFIKRRSRIFGRWFDFCGTQDDYQMRLFIKERGEYSQPIHEKIILQGKKGYIKKPILHYTYENISDHLKRLEKYTTIEANYMLEQGKEACYFDILLRPVARFIKLYFLKLGFRDGIEGLLFSFLSGFYDFIKYAKLYEMQKSKSS